MHPCKIELEVSEILGDDEVRDTEDFGLIQHDGCEIQAPCKWRLSHHFRQPSNVENIMPQDLEAKRRRASLAVLYKVGNIETSKSFRNLCKQSIN